MLEILEIVPFAIIIVIIFESITSQNLCQIQKDRNGVQGLWSGAQKTNLSTGNRNASLLINNPELCLCVLARQLMYGYLRKSKAIILT